MARYDELRARLPPAALTKVQGIAARLKGQLSRTPNASAALNVAAGSLQYDEKHVANVELLLQNIK